MPVSMNNTQIVFNDATTQTTAPVNTNANVVAISATSPIVSSGGTSPTLSHANSGVTAASYTNANITVNAQGHITSASSGASASGTVTSVATGNGLQGGTITGSGTLSVACPAFNTVGSYTFATVANWQTGSSINANGGNNYSTGGSNGQFQSTVFQQGGANWSNQNNLSGTWKYMGANSGGDGFATAIACRVS